MSMSKVLSIMMLACLVLILYSLVYERQAVGYGVGGDVRHYNNPFTGCHYLYINQGGIIPMVDVNGVHLCDNRDK